MIQAVLPGQDQVSYSYTVGFSKNHGHPEIFMVGFHPDMARSLLNVAGGHVRVGMRFDSPILSDVIVEDYAVAFRPIQFKSVVRHSNAGRQILGKAFDGVQIFLPDATGLFPWDAGCDPAYASVQTSLLTLVGDPPQRQ